MAQNMSTEQRRFFKDLLRLAEPYPDDAPELLALDDDTVDVARLRASMAKKFLERDNMEKAKHRSQCEETGKAESFVKKWLDEGWIYRGG